MPRRTVKASASNAERASSARPVDRVPPSHPARAPGPASPPRSPARNGTNDSPSEPGRAVAAKATKESQSRPSTSWHQDSASPPFWTASISYQPPSASAYRWLTGASRGVGVTPGRMICTPVPTFTTTVSAAVRGETARLQRRERAGRVGSPGHHGHRRALLHLLVVDRRPGRLPHHRVAADDLRQLLGADPGRSRCGGRPVVGRDVPEQGGGRVAAFGDPVTGQLGAQPVLGGPDQAGGIQVRRFVLTEPGQHRPGHAGEDRVGEAGAGLTGQLQPAREHRGGALVRPQHRRPGRPAVLTGQDDPVHLSGDADRLETGAVVSRDAAPGGPPSRRPGRSPRTPAAASGRRTTPRTPRGRRRPRQPASASARWCRGRCRGSSRSPDPRRHQPLRHELVGVPGEVVAVVPQVAPHGQLVAQLGVDDG